MIENNCSISFLFNSYQIPSFSSSVSLLAQRTPSDAISRISIFGETYSFSISPYDFDLLLIDEMQISLTPRNAIAVNSIGETSSNNIFACADAVNGPSLVVKAISAGRILAENVDKKLQNNQ